MKMPGVRLALTSRFARQSLHFGAINKRPARNCAAQSRSAGVTLLDGPFLDFRDPWGDRVEIVGYDNIQPQVVPAWRETRDLNRIEHRRDPAEGATCSDAVEADGR